MLDDADYDFDDQDANEHDTNLIDANVMDNDISKDYRLSSAGWSRIRQAEEDTPARFSKEY